MTHQIYLALGANLGDRLANLKSVYRGLPPKVRLLAESPIYQTAPWGFLDQPDFLNQVIQAETHMAPLELLTYLKLLETQIGRRPTFQNGPRLIDVDILFYDDWVVSYPTLTIPHPRLHERAFVLAPLADLAPDLRHPLLQKTAAQMLTQVDLEGVERYRG